MPSVGVSSARCGRTAGEILIYKRRLRFGSELSERVDTLFRVSDDRVCIVFSNFRREKSSKGALNVTSQKFENQSLFFSFSFGVSLVHSVSANVCRSVPLGYTRAYGVELSLHIIS